MAFTENKPVENALGTIGAVLWTIQILPQIVKSYRTKSTLGLSAGLMFIWAIASWFLGSYIVVQRLSIPLQIQPQLFGSLAAVSVAQCLYYDKGWSKLRAVLFFITFEVLFAGFEAGSVFALWAGQDRGVYWPTTMYGYISAVLLAVALLPQYWEIYRLREVVGISLTFMAVDILGGIFSFLSLFFRDSLDVAAFVSYALVVLLDGIVVILAFILNPIARRRRAHEKAMHTIPTGETERGGTCISPSPFVENDVEAAGGITPAHAHEESAERWEESPMGTVLRRPSTSHSGLERR
ncbi:hypothetical protein JCM24511_04392 [Saitozyma sp. JCM 24511]|nr:hypothetical protein JCM24511_04392 [Saitozyma sp. JCM 24511]